MKISKKMKTKFSKKKLDFKKIVIQKKFLKAIRRMNYLQLICQGQYQNLAIKKSEILKRTKKMKYLKKELK